VGCDSWWICERLPLRSRLKAGKNVRGFLLPRSRYKLVKDEVARIER
jgi:hypothetical protein